MANNYPTFFSNETAKLDYTKFEKVKTTVYNNSQEASIFLAQSIQKLILQNFSKNKKTILGLATGSSLSKIHKYLVKFHKENGLSFKNVITFNLDEYYSIDPNSLQSYARFMNEHLFDHIDIEKENLNIPDGSIPKEKVKNFCTYYEALISSYGGLDIQLTGIGRTGHVGFNEPGSSINSKTRLINLDKVTILDAPSDFFGEENVPSKAITLGIGTILSAKKIFLIASWGEGKAAIVKEALEGEIKEAIPATFLQNHNNCEFILDNAATSELTRYKTPWLVAECDWNDKLIKRAAIWLSTKMEKQSLN